MPQQRMDIRMIKDILRLKYQGALSHEAIARSLSIFKGVVAKYLSLAAAAGLDWQATAELDEAALERRLLGRSAAETRVALADFAHVHIELHRKGVTLMLLWQEYRAAHEGRRTWAYTQFCEHYKAFAKTLKRSMRQQRRAGEKLFIDYAGPTLELADGTRAQIFVAAMGARRAAAIAEQSPVPEARWQPGEPLRHSGLSGAVALAGAALAVGHLQDGEGSHRLPRRGRGPPLQRGALAGRVGAGGAHHRRRWRCCEATSAAPHCSSARS
jgi:hypothetical protein